jgi:hypothetical protein
MLNAKAHSRWCTYAFLVLLDDWSTSLLWCGFAVVAVGLIGGAFLKGRRRQRRTYWVCWLVGGLIMAAAMGHSDPRQGLAMAAFAAIMSVMIAFFKSPYLKIGGTIYALSLDDRQPDPPEDGEPAVPPVPRPTDSYGNLSAATYWWLMTALLGSGAIVIAFEGFSAEPLWPAGFFSLCVGITGYADASHGFGVVRGRYLPATVLTLVSIPLLLAPPLLYLVGYAIGTNFPQRRPQNTDAHTEVSE